MFRLRFNLVLSLACVAVLAQVLFAYDLALKDGRVIHFSKYRIAENKLFVTTDDGKETDIPFDSIDIDLTKQLNKGQSPPLVLPDISDSHGNDGSSGQSSLGEVSRRIRSNKPAPTTHRTFTNDNVQSATDEDRIQDWIRAGSATDSSNHADSKEFREKALALARVSQHLTEQEIAAMSLGSLSVIKFPGRDSWQAQLYAAHQKFYSLLAACFERYDEESQAACSKTEYALTQLRSLQQEGSRRATLWKTDREK